MDTTNPFETQIDGHLLSMIIPPPPSPVGPQKSHNVNGWINSKGKKSFDLSYSLPA